MGVCISPLYIRGTYVPCGKCNFCLERLRGDWSFRIGEELKAAKSAAFLTLTYDEDHVPVHPFSGLPTLVKSDWQKFMKRLRKEQNKYLYSGGVKGQQIYAWDSIRYYGVGEYGSNTERPHYHAIIFNVHREVMNKIAGVWKKGFVYVGQVSQASIHYVTGYVITKGHEYPGREPPFQCISNRSGGLGKEYVSKMRSYHKYGEVGYVTYPGGIKGNLPKFYKNKIFNVHEKERLRLQNIFRGDEEYRKELDRISELHDRPLEYMEEQKKEKYKSIEKKLVKAKKL